MHKLIQIITTLALGTLVAGSTPAFAQQQQKISKYDLDIAQQMSRSVASDVKKYYYDTKYHGMNVDARFAEVDKSINAAVSLNMAMSNIAQALTEFNDSHLFFSPPPRSYHHDYGWRMQFFGDKGVFITAVRPGSDADKKGVRPGDQILALNGYQPTRDNLWQMKYVFWTLRPQPALHLQLKSPDGKIREVDTEAALRELSKQVDLTDYMHSSEFWLDYDNEIRQERLRSKEIGDVDVVKLPNFDFNPERTGEILHWTQTRPNLVLDLRGNPGGIVESLQNLLGSFFDHEVKIADRVGRKNLKPQIAKPFGKTYKGKVVILVDSQSASAAELFARVMQLQGRGTVIGDRSEGAVMESRFYDHQMGTGTVIFYGVSVTEADLIMSDGRSLEHNGVIPDTVMLPTPNDLATGRDPVLAAAIEQAGGHITPEDAGKLFPIIWPRK